LPLLKFQPSYVENVKKEYWRGDTVFPDGIGSIIKQSSADDYSDIDSAKWKQWHHWSKHWP